MKIIGKNLNLNTDFSSPKRTKDNTIEKSWRSLGSVALRGGAVLSVEDEDAPSAAPPFICLEGMNPCRRNISYGLDSDRVRQSPARSHANFPHFHRPLGPTRIYSGPIFSNNFCGQLHSSGDPTQWVVVLFRVILSSFFVVVFDSRVWIGGTWGWKTLTTDSGILFIKFVWSWKQSQSLYRNCEKKKKNFPLWSQVTTAIRNLEISPGQLQQSLRKKGRRKIGKSRGGEVKLAILAAIA